MGLDDGQWIISDFGLSDLDDALLALKVWDGPASAESLADALLARSRVLVQELGTLESRRHVSVFCDAAGDILHQLAKRAEAAALYREGLEIRRDLLQKLGTPEARRDLLVSCERVGHILHEQGKRVEAERLYQEALKIARVLEQELGTSEARDHLASLLNRLESLKT